MKLRLLFFAAFLALASCSGDDSGTPVTDTENPDEVVKDLKEITYYDANGVIEALLKFEDNKLTERYIYNEGEQFYEDYYSYDSYGRLINRDITSNDEEVHQTVTYDNLGRIITIFNDYGGGSRTEERSFDYSSPDKIIMTEVSAYEGTPNSSRQTTYKLMQDGRVNKIESGSHISEAIFEGNNMISMNDFYDELSEMTTTYSYDMQTVVKGKYLNINSNRYGNNKANPVLYSETFVSANDNYVIEIYSSGDTVTNSHSTAQYELDTDGYPIAVKVFTEGNLTSNAVISYQ